jgi:ParB/RepB/Spo0J family partition protein
METLQNTPIQSPEYRDLPITQLIESPTNPRKRYDQASLDELAQSFRSRGVLEPLLVRPIQPEQFEVVAGSRRYRAARIAELETVPTRVREMTAPRLSKFSASRTSREKISTLSKKLRDSAHCWSCRISNTRSHSSPNAPGRSPRTWPAG